MKSKTKLYMRLPVQALIIVSLALAASMTYNHFKTPPDHSHEPQIGTWLVTIGPKQCHEVYEFHADNTLTRYSGERIVSWQYASTPWSTDQKIWEFRGHIVEARGGPDCSGKASDDHGGEHRGLMQFTNGFTRMQICDMDQKSCSPALEKTSH